MSSRKQPFSPQWHEMGKRSGHPAATARATDHTWHWLYDWPHLALPLWLTTLGTAFMPDTVCLCLTTLGTACMTDHTGHCLYAWPHLAQCVYDRSYLAQCVYAWPHLADHTWHCLYDWPQLAQCVYDWPHMALLLWLTTLGTLSLCLTTLGTMSLWLNTLRTAFRTDHTWHIVFMTDLFRALCLWLTSPGHTIYDWPR